MASIHEPNTSASLAEEKKDDDDIIYPAADIRGRPQSAVNDRDAPKHNDALAAADAHDQAPESPKKKSPLLLLLCASGITSCYLWYGTIQEHIFHMDKKNAADSDGNGDDDQSITLFLLATGTFSSFLLALVWTAIGPILLSSQKKTEAALSTATTASNAGGLNHPLIVLTSLAYLSAMAASNESLRYVSYPTCVLAKSSKLIPTMVVGWLVDAWRGRRTTTGKGGVVGARRKGGVDVAEWLGAALITVGILSFQYIQLQKQSNGGRHHGGGKEDEGDSPYGLALLGLSLFMDGLLGACQSALKRKDPPVADGTSSASCYRPPSAMETMLYINLYATLILLPASHHMGQFARGMNILLSNDSAKSALLLQLNLSASLGQVFVFLTIHHFSPLTCTTITTTRKFFTILLSVYKFGHVLDIRQWGGVALVFGGLYLEIAARLFERGGDGKDGSQKSKED